MALSEKERAAYLDQLVKRVFAADEELKQIIAAEDWASYESKRKTLQTLKEEYERLTGIYPMLPPRIDLVE